MLSTTVILSFFLFLSRVNYEYVESLNRLVALRQTKQISLGKLTKNGDFVFESKMDLIPAYSGPHFELINFPRKNSMEEICYEFRSGNLILGKINEDFEFVPLANSRVILFKDYFPQLGLRIWNLPGYFKTKRK